MFNSLQDFYLQAQEPIAAFNEFVADHGLYDKVVADHICYKVSSPENFEQVRRVLETESRFVHQVNLSGRRVATISTSLHLETSVGKVSLIELSDQKPSGSQKDGFHHIEVYPMGLRSVSCSDLVSKLTSEGERVNYIQRLHHSTYDVALDNHLVVRISQGPLIDKIRKEIR